MSIARKISQFTRSEIDRLYKETRPVLKHDGFTLLQTPRMGEFARILIVISKKVGNAPTRNKLRRQIKSIFYEEKLFQKDHDWVIIVRKPATLLSFEQLKAILVKAMSCQ